ncbi:hypothetical protein C8R43DRAFT_953808 [Mycena crocata]|nr:hypothetical protein C8R43DRAFT_953808 [Mycena crocata]
MYSINYNKIESIPKVNRPNNTPAPMPRRLRRSPAYHGVTQGDIPAGAFGDPRTWEGHPCAGSDMYKRNQWKPNDLIENPVIRPAKGGSARGGTLDGDGGPLKTARHNVEFATCHGEAGGAMSERTTAGFNDFAAKSFIEVTTARLSYLAFDTVSAAVKGVGGWQTNRGKVMKKIHYLTSERSREEAGKERIAGDDGWEQREGGGRKQGAFKTPTGPWDLGCPSRDQIPDTRAVIEHEHEHEHGRDARGVSGSECELHFRLDSGKWVEVPGLLPAGTPEVRKGLTG